MSEGIQYTVRYEGQNEVQEIETVRWFGEERGMIKVMYYPDAEKWTPTSETVRMAESTKFIPKERLIEIIEH